MQTMANALNVAMQPVALLTQPGRGTTAIGTCNQLATGLFRSVCVGGEAHATQHAAACNYENRQHGGVMPGQPSAEPPTRTDPLAAWLQVCSA